MVMEPKPSKKGAIKPITPRPAKFCELVAAGKTYAEAYKTAYNRPHLMPQDAAHRGHKVAQQPAVKARIAWLQHKSEAKTILSINDRLNLLAMDAQVPALTAAERNARARTIEVYTKIAGGAAPDVVIHEHSGPSGGPIPVAASVTIQQLPVRQRIAAMVRAKKERDANDS